MKPILWLRGEDNVLDENDKSYQKQASNVQYSIGRIGKAINLPFNSYIQIRNNNFLNQKEGSFACWIKPNFNVNTDGDRHDIMAMGESFCFFMTFQAGGNPPSSADIRNTLSFIDFPENGNLLDFSLYVHRAGIMDELKDWMHITCTWGDRKNIYINGKLYNSGDNSHYNKVWQYIYLGMSSHFGNEKLFFVNSLLDEIMFFDYELSARDVEVLYSVFQSYDNMIINNMGLKKEFSIKGIWDDIFDPPTPQPEPDPEPEPLLRTWKDITYYMDRPVYEWYDAMPRHIQQSLIDYWIVWNYVPDNIGWYWINNLRLLYNVLNDVMQKNIAVWASLYGVETTLFK